MQNIEPFDYTAEPGVVAFHSVPGFRHYNPIGSVHGGYAAIFLDLAMGLAGQSTPARGAGSSLRPAAPPPPRRASPTAKAACWHTPPRLAWFSRYRSPKKAPGRFE